MGSIILKRIVRSSLDSVVKYIFLTEDNLVIEFSYIDKNDGKDIICVPSQTMCRIGCKFCHTKEYIGKIKDRNLTSEEIFEGVSYVVSDMKLCRPMLLVSYMGCGEPLNNTRNVIGSMVGIRNHFENVRFAVATSLPAFLGFEFRVMARMIERHKLNVKLHLSLHYTTDILRKEWMPNSLNIAESLFHCYRYKTFTKNNVEIHYALIEGINDSVEDADRLVGLLNGKDFNVKFLFYNAKENLSVKASDMSALNRFKSRLDEAGILNEYYVPPGLDIGASCGQFLMEELEGV